MVDGKVSISFVQNIVAQELRVQVRDVLPIEGQGIINAVYRVETDQGTAVLRCNAVDDPHQNYAKEAWCIEKVGAVGVPVPEVLGVGEQSGIAYMIQRFIEGETGDDRAPNRLEIWRQLGVYARQFNAIKVQGFGGDMDCLGTFNQTWQDVQEDVLSDLFRDDFWVQIGGFRFGQIDWLRAQIEALSDLNREPGLCLVDMGANNTILKEDGTLFMIDWEMVMGAPVPESQIARIASYWGYPSQLVDAFIEGYDLTESEVRDIEPLIKVLTVQHALNHVRWAQDFMPERVDEYTQSAHATAFSLYGAVLKGQ